jgi:hypothetical protein
VIEAGQGVVLRPVARLLHPVDEGRHSEEGPSGLLGGHPPKVRSQSRNGIIGDLYGIIGNRSVKAVVYGPPLAGRSSQRPTPRYSAWPGQSRRAPKKTAKEWIEGT